MTRLGCMLCAAAALGGSPNPALAQSKDYIQIFNYPNATSCGDWTLERAKGNRAWQGNEGWVLGFVSGHNGYSSKPLTGSQTNAVGLLAWVDNYCRQNPLNSVASAAFALVKELEAKGL